MDMDLAERGGVEWVPEFCPVKGSSSSGAYDWSTDSSYDVTDHSHLPK